jgi:hypothetical protein
MGRAASSWDRPPRAPAPWLVEWCGRLPRGKPQVRRPHANERGYGKGAPRLHDVVYPVFSVLERDEIPHLDRSRNMNDAEIVSGQVVDENGDPDHAVNRATAGLRCLSRLQLPWWDGCPCIGRRVRGYEE